MGSSLGSLLVLAAEAGDGKGGGNVWFTYISLGAIMVLFYFLFLRPQRQESARREAMIRALKPNDHVVTSGGIYGVVTNVNSKENTATIRVDENNNTRMKVALAAIGRVLGDDDSGDSTPKKD